MSTSVFAILLLAGLFAMPATRWSGEGRRLQRLADVPRHITLPFIMPFAFIAMTIRSLDVARAYEHRAGMTDGGPAGADRASLDAHRAGRLRERTDGAGQCHGLHFDAALGRLHLFPLHQSSSPRAATWEGPNEPRIEEAASRRRPLAADFLLLVVICVPGLWVVLSAFRPNREILAKPPIWIPEELTLSNFAKIFGFGQEQVAIPVLSYFWNSLVIATTSTLNRAGDRHGRRLRLRAVPLPVQERVVSRPHALSHGARIALSLPVFMLWSRMGIIDTQLGLIIVYVSLNVPFTIWLIDGFFRQIPMSLSEAAQVDGCTRWQAFWKIEFPLARSGIAAAGVFAFLTSWNEFALASQLTRSTDSKTLPSG